MDLDGFLKLNDSQRANAQAQQQIATGLADIPQKLAQADLTEQQALKQSLQNIQILQVIDWDALAEDHLLRMRTKALQEETRIIQERSRLKTATLHVGAILRGGGMSLEAVGWGWQAFGYLMGHSGASAQLKAAEFIPDASAYSADSWGHPTHNLPPMPADKNGGALLAWAARHSCYPKWGTMGLRFVGEVLQVLNDGAAGEAAEIEKQIEASRARANEIQNRDWDRLKIDHSK